MVTVREKVHVNEYNPELFESGMHCSFHFYLWGRMKSIVYKKKMWIHETNCSLAFWTAAVQRNVDINSDKRHMIFNMPQRAPRLTAGFSDIYCEL